MESPMAIFTMGKPAAGSRWEFTLELRNQVESLAKEMQGYAQRGYTPKGRLQKHCNACSLKDVCLPQLSRSPSVREYIEQRMEELV